MIARDTGKPAIREEAFQFRNIGMAEPLVQKGGVFQGPYLLPWTPLLADEDTLVVYMYRSPHEVARSVERLRERGISTPFFTRAQAEILWLAIAPMLPHAITLPYWRLSKHELWVEKRIGWGHRQTR